MKNYSSKAYIQQKNQARVDSLLQSLGMTSKKGMSKIGITRKSHEESKKHRKIAAKSVRINRKTGKVRR